MDIFFGDNQIISNGDIIRSVTERDVLMPLRINLPSLNLNKYHLLVIYDVDAPYPNDNNMSPFIHYMVSNIPGVNLNRGEFVYSYVEPSPPKTSNQHEYVIEVYEQEGPVDIEPTDSIYTLPRNNFPLKEFVNEGNLKLVARSSFKFGHSHMVKQIIMKSNNNHNGKLSRAKWFNPDSSLSEGEQKFCRCTIKAASKQPETCIIKNAWYEERDGHTCANPYAVCAHSTGHSSKECGENFNFDTFPTDYLRTYILMMKDSIEGKGVVVPSYTNQYGAAIPITMDRESMLDIIKQYKMKE